MVENPSLLEAEVIKFFLQKALNQSAARNATEAAAKEEAAAFLRCSAFSEFDRKKSDQRRYTPFFRLFSPKIQNEEKKTALNINHSFFNAPFIKNFCQRAENFAFCTPLYSKNFPSLTSLSSTLSDNSFTALSKLLADKGVDIDLPFETKANPLILNDTVQPDELNYHSQSGLLPDLHRHRRIHLAPKSSLVLIEILTGEGSYLRTSLNEITLETGTDLTHYRLILDSKSGHSVLNTQIHQEENASYRQINAVFQGGLLLDETVTDLAEKEASTVSQTLLFLTENTHADLTAKVRHSAPKTSSKQTVHCLVNDQSFGAFHGHVQVAPKAQKAESVQLIKTLLLSPKAQMNSRPELEIFANDVKCSHGSATGGLDPDQLFFLRSRGLSEQIAQHLLSEAFFIEEILKIPHIPMQDLWLLCMKNLWKDLSL